MLEKVGVTDFRFIVESDDVGSHIRNRFEYKVASWLNEDRRYQEEYETCDDRGLSGCRLAYVSPAQPMAPDIAVSEGALAGHWVLDDNLRNQLIIDHGQRRLYCRERTALAGFRSWKRCITML